MKNKKFNFFDVVVPSYTATVITILYYSFFSISADIELIDYIVPLSIIVIISIILHNLVTSEIVDKRSVTIASTVGLIVGMVLWKFPFRNYIEGSPIEVGNTLGELYFVVILLTIVIMSVLASSIEAYGLKKSSFWISLMRYAGIYGSLLLTMIVIGIIWAGIIERRITNIK